MPIERRRADRAITRERHRRSRAHRSRSIDRERLARPRRDVGRRRALDRCPSELRTWTTCVAPTRDAKTRDDDGLGEGNLELWANMVRAREGEVSSGDDRAGTIGSIDPRGRGDADQESRLVDWMHPMDFERLRRARFQNRGRRERRSSASASESVRAGAGASCGRGSRSRGCRRYRWCVRPGRREGRGRPRRAPRQSRRRPPTYSVLRRISRSGSICGVVEQHRRMMGAWSVDQRCVDDRCRARSRPAEFLEIFILFGALDDAVGVHAETGSFSSRLANSTQSSTRRSHLAKSCST